MPQNLLSPFDTNWFATAFSTPALQFARQRCRLSPQLFPDERLCMMRQTLLNGTYQPQAPYQFPISLPDKAPRILTIPQP